jgi:hypothetical protein
MELVARETQLAALGEHLDAATAGSGRLVLAVLLAPRLDLEAEPEREAVRLEPRVSCD